VKIGIIGAGAVGAACLTAVVTRCFAREVVVLDRDRNKARGLATDVQYGAVLSPDTEVRDGDYADLEGASLVMITAGVNEREGGATNRKDPTGRLRLLDTNVTVYKDIVPRLQAVAPEALALVVTDPPDPFADAVRMLGFERVFSTGTYLDSLRFRFHLPAACVSARIRSRRKYWASMARPRCLSGPRRTLPARRFASCWGSPRRTGTSFAVRSSRRSASPI